MATDAKREARLNFRLPANLKQVIEEAAASLGQTVSNFAVAVLVQSARSVIRDRSITDLSRRDRDRLLAYLDDEAARPNKALKAAVAKYKKAIA